MGFWSRLLGMDKTELSDYEVMVIRQGLADAANRLARTIAQAKITDVPTAAEIIGLIHKAINMLEPQ